MEKKKPPVQPEAQEDYFFDVLEKQNGVVSGTECTGMMYFPAHDEFEAESYNEIYVVPKAPNKKEKELRDTD